ncbi:MAG: hypothetical protein A4E20_03965 [Nitrospira sp. SG-bin2]|jgi:hypothetical protein|uniref:hypothetical protein n=1 Tax=Nitrospira cf. moscoviensis SBR1015 TaxID=96242 RepID=UPI000A0C05CC|nr:hypothetical protein [Nitrospira cf. moscoviensis SBR1015]OQW31450.1 MAG: hypothetical protein A4E20_03965 [Nitrospira sp. SG-bin2]
MTSFKVVHGEISLQAHFLVPLFDLLDPPASRVHSALYSDLSEFGISLNDVKLVYGVPNLAEVSVSYYLLNLNALVKLSLDRLEITFSETTQLSHDQMIAVYKKTFHSLGQMATGFKVREYNVTLALHGLLEDKSTVEFWKDLVPKVPMGLGPTSGQGVVFYHGAHDKIASSSVVLDTSVRVPNGIFFRTTVNLDGAKLSTDDLPGFVEKTFDTVSSNLDMTLT